MGEASCAHDDDIRAPRKDPLSGICALWSLASRPFFSLPS